VVTKIPISCWAEFYFKILFGIEINQNHKRISLFGYLCSLLIALPESAVSNVVNCWIVNGPRFQARTLNLKKVKQRKNTAGKGSQYKLTKRKFDTFNTISVCFREYTLASNLKLKKDYRLLLVHIWAW